MLIPTGLTLLQYTANLEGRVVKEVQCEACNFPYVYLLLAESEGNAASVSPVGAERAASQARVIAQRRLNQALEQGNAYVPCPRCGHVATAMFAAARWVRYAWLKTLAIWALIVGSLLLLPAASVFSLMNDAHNVGFATIARVLWVGVAILIASAPLCLLTRWMLNQHYDPNSEPVDERMRLGAQLAVGKDQFRESQQR